MSETNQTITEIKSESENQETPTRSEEYAYLDRGGFSSEKFKIELRGLPKFYGIAELKKLMNQKLGLNTSKIKRPRNGSHWLYACFQNDEERTKAISALNGYSWKGKILIAEEAKPAPDPLVRKRKKDEEESQNKKKKEQENKSQEERLKDAVTPYWNIPYEDQLKLKESEIKNLLMNFDNEVWIIDKERRKEIELNRKLYNGLSFDLKPIERSPVIEGYRNKCEFTVGIDDETHLPTVGFRLGSYVTGIVGVAPVMSLTHISEKMKKAVLLFQEFVRQSELAPFSPADYSGYWRYLTVRESTHSGELMLIIAMHPQDLTAEKLEELSKKLVAHFSSEEAVAYGVKSLYIEVIRKRRVGEESSKPTHLMGSTHIIDNIMGLQFRISAEAFFQINSAGAGVLFAHAIAQGARAGRTALDICCGTGTIGLCFAQHCDKVLGLELVAEAVKDAKANAELNNIENCEFFTGKAEDILPSVLARATGDDIIAIVDPPRAGLHMRAVTQLRNTEKVKSLIYISCSPASVVKNFVDLTRPSSKTLRGAPFLPVRAVPVDMFPHTKHVELLILFQRKDVSTSKVTDEVSEAQVNIAETNDEVTEASTAKVNITETKDELSEAKVNIAETNDEVTEASTAKVNITETKDELSEAKVNITETKDELSEAKVNITETKDELSEAKVNIAETNDEVTEASTAKVNITETKDELSEAKVNITETKDELSEAKVNIAETNDEVTEASTAKVNITETKDELSEAKVNIAETNDEVTEASTAKVNITETKDELSEAKVNITETKDEVTEASEAKVNITETKDEVTEASKAKLNIAEQMSR